MLFKSGDKLIQLTGVIFALFIIYYAYVYQNICLWLVGFFMFVYDGYLLLHEPECVCSYDI